MCLLISLKSCVVYIYTPISVHSTCTYRHYTQADSWKFVSSLFCVMSSSAFWLPSWASLSPSLHRRRFSRVRTLQGNVIVVVLATILAKVVALFVVHRGHPRRKKHNQNKSNKREQQQKHRATARAAAPVAAISDRKMAPFRIARWP